MKKHIIYTSYFSLPEKFLTNSKRVKLSDFGDVVSECCRKAIEDEPHLIEMNTEVSEVVRVNCRNELFGSYDRIPRTYAKVVVDLEVPFYAHVRKRVLQRFRNQSVNYMPKLESERVVFRFFQKLGFAVYEVYEQPIIITVQDGNYREDIYYCLRNEPIYSPKNFREYIHLADKIYGDRKIGFDD